MIMAAAVGLTFLLASATSSASPCDSVLLVGCTAHHPAVDLSILGLLLTTRYLALRGASEEGLRPLRRFTLFVGVVTLWLTSRSRY